MNDQKRLLILSGPTGTGKTALSNLIAQDFPVEIVNADMAQMYSACSVGTAKPDWKINPTPHHLFDSITIPQEKSVAQFRDEVFRAVDEIFSRGKIPLIVGGSLFYIKSLFFPPRKNTPRSSPYKKIDVTDKNKLWERLNEVDPKRADLIHPHDFYRLERALVIWNETGIKPSECAPVFSFPYSFLFVFLKPDRSELNMHIEKRAEKMIQDLGWIEEVERLSTTSWKNFIVRKKFIGYPELFNWLDSGKKEDALDGVVAAIKRETKRYAKRQYLFWMSFKEQLKKALPKKIQNNIIESQLRGSDAIHDIKKSLETFFT